MKNKNQSNSELYSIKIDKPKPNKKYKNSKSKDYQNFKSQSNKNTISKVTKLDKNEASLFKDEKSQHVHLSDNYKKELHDKYSIFLKSKKFKISNEFDAKNSKKFLDKKDKYMQKIVLNDIIETNDKDENNEKDENNTKVKGRRISRRKSGTLKNFENYCIIVSDYDDASKDEIKINYSVKFEPRKIDKIKKNKNLSKYFLNNNNNESKTHSKFSEMDKI